MCGASCNGLDEYYTRGEKESMKIGIGICTYNRLGTLRGTIEAMIQNTKLPHRLVVASDGSTDGTSEWLLKNKVPCILGDNQGMHYNKNRLLTALQDCDYIFIFDDDLYPHVPEWIEHYLNGFECTGYNYFCYKTGRLSKFTHVQYPKCTILLSHGYQGNLLIYRKKVLEVCGGFNTDYYGYGYGTTEFSMRIIQAGLAHPDAYADVLEGKLCIHCIPPNQSRKTGQHKTPEAVAHKEGLRLKNLRRYKRFKRDFKRSPLEYRHRDFRVPIEVRE
jgi:glycosyltransferase involved in cell wall biosynthesis